MDPIMQPVPDPLPWVTNRLRRAGAFIEVTEDVQGDWMRGQYGEWTRSVSKRTRLSNDGAAALLDILTQTVSALHDDDKPYVVVLSKENASAATLLERKVVEVGSKPMKDNDLTDGQKAAVMAGLVLHEVGHIRYGRQYSAAITRLFGKENVTGAISTLSNLAADCHDEAAACRAFPGLAPAVAVTLWWVGGKGKGDKVDADQMLHASAVQRVNLAIAACRYPWQVRWGSKDARDWYAWWADWGQRAAAAEAPKDHALLVQEAIEKVRDTTYTEPEEPETPTQPQPGPSGSEPQPSPRQDRSDEKPEPEPEPEATTSAPTDDSDDADESDDESGDGAGEDEGDEDGDEDGDSGHGDEDADADEPTDGEGEDSDDFSEQGGFGGEYDADENNGTYDDPCVKQHSTDRQDRLLQAGAEHINRGKREGMRIRTYHHASSRWGESGRRVVAHGKKGKRWTE